MRKIMAAVGAVILGGTLFASPSVANAAGCPYGLKYRVLGDEGVRRGIYELPRRLHEDREAWDVLAGTAVKGPGGSADGATPVTHFWHNGYNRWIVLPTISTDQDIDWMSTVFLQRLDGCASA